MLKISQAGTPHHSVALKLEGRVIGAWAGELLKVADLLLAAETNLTLDLAEVSFADETGVDVLASLGSRGVILSRPSPFLAAQLKPATAK